MYPNSASTSSCVAATCRVIGRGVIVLVREQPYDFCNSLVGDVLEIAQFIDAHHLLTDVAREPARFLAERRRGQCAGVIFDALGHAEHEGARFLHAFHGGGEVGRAVLEAVLPQEVRYGGKAARHDRGR